MDFVPGRGKFFFCFHFQRVRKQNQNTNVYGIVLHDDQKKLRFCRFNSIAGGDERTEWNSECSEWRNYINPP